MASLLNNVESPIMNLDTENCQQEVLNDEEDGDEKDETERGGTEIPQISDQVSTIDSTHEESSPPPTNEITTKEINQLKEEGEEQYESNELESSKKDENIVIEDTDDDNQRAKRRRKAPSIYKDNDMNTEQLRLLQQAVENSRVENLNVEVHIPEAPVFHPTIEEFVDPIKYIAKIKSQAIQFGICRIIPPEGWKYPTQIDTKSTKKFATKLQRMNLMQEGRAMGDGSFYTLNEYEKMANNFKDEWAKRHHDGSVTDEQLEADYWKLIKNYSAESPSVEYGNDLSTHEYNSGFFQRLPTDPPLGASTAPFGSEEYYRTCGWNLNNISAWPGSSIGCITHPIDGINKPWVYHGMLFASFCWHREDIYLASINYLHEGSSKQWYGIPGNKAKSFKNVLEKQLKLRIKEVPDLEHHITTQISPSILLQSNVPVFKTKQNHGEFIITFPEAYHAGFSYGFNSAEAVNFATSDWIKHGSQSVVDYRLKAKKEVFSFDRLLFTLTYHLDEYNIESCEMLLKELEILQYDEKHFRIKLLDSGIQDVSSIANLPKEGKMCYDIPENVANYDDQRICGTCQHTCFLSAICCHCSELEVSCLKCCDWMCRCPRSNKFLLEWHTIEEINDVINKTKNHIQLLKQNNNNNNNHDTIKISEENQKTAAAEIDVLTY
mmetsp:Transcript_36608/g.47271  ORF Transcript_36608/g.47271 Transcript_36608/m.47271 type:complete len:663 (-) Transcript_36608:454-2442(-)